MTTDPSITVMEGLAKGVLDTLPEMFKADLSDVVLRVVDFATDEQLASVGLNNRWHLSGLYEGHPVPDQSIWDNGTLPPRIWLFRQPLLAEMRETRVSLEAIVRHVVIHEAGHHFGFSDEDMHRLEHQAPGN
ncbi:metallopeptidase family protein [Qipengyuania sp.]|uniref:metallopeptidase family protein n=1 Tax=Qipengyuania sp. TaxID=2004515 RepID=UPI0035C82D14